MGSACSTTDLGLPPIPVFPLLELPPELRTKVYHFALLSPHDQVRPSNGKDIISTVDCNVNLNGAPCRFCEDCRLPLSHSSHSGQRRTNLDILLVCRQIHEEAECIWYAKTCFAFGCPIDAIRFFETLGENRRMAVTSIAFSSPYKSNLGFDLHTFWGYVSRTGILMSPKWLAVGIPASYPLERVHLEKEIEQIVLHVPLCVREAPGGLYRYEHSPCDTHWYPGGLPITDVVPWKDINESFDIFILRLTANDFFLDKSKASRQE